MSLSSNLHARMQPERARALRRAGGRCTSEGMCARVRACPLTHQPFRAPPSCHAQPAPAGSPDQWSVARHQTQERPAGQAGWEGGCAEGREVRAEGERAHQQVGSAQTGEAGRGHEHVAAAMEAGARARDARDRPRAAAACTQDRAGGMPLAECPGKLPYGMPAVLLTSDMRFQCTGLGRS